MMKRECMEQEDGGTLSLIQDAQPAGIQLNLHLGYANTWL